MDERPLDGGVALETSARHGFTVGNHRAGWRSRPALPAEPEPASLPDGVSAIQARPGWRTARYNNVGTLHARERPIVGGEPGQVGNDKRTNADADGRLHEILGRLEFPREIL